MLTTNSEKDFHELTKNYQFYITTYILEINPIANACEKTLYQRLHMDTEIWVSFSRALK